MAYTIPNRTGVGVTENPQSIWMQTDIDAVLLGISGLTGVVSGCVVSAQVVVDMTVAVASGVVRVNGTPVSVMSGNLTIAPANTLSPRIDLITVSSSGVKTVTAGSAVTNPEAPAHPVNSALIAMVLVPAAATAIGNTRIIDKRVILAAGGSLGSAQAQGVCQGRLTTESGVPVSSSDRTAQSTLYFALLGGNQLGLYTASGWVLVTCIELSLALSGLTSGKNYDVFAYPSGGTAALELSAAWTNDTTRANALASQDGVWVKSVDHTRLYLGTIRTTGTTTTEDSAAKRFVWNAYNRTRRQMVKNTETLNWSYNSLTPRQANGNVANQIEYVVGLSLESVTARVQASTKMLSGSGSTAIGVGVDSTSVNSSFAVGCFVGPIVWVPAISDYEGLPGIGYHTLVWLEWANGDGHFLSTFGTDTMQAGIYGSLFN